MLTLFRNNKIAFAISAAFLVGCAEEPQSEVQEELTLKSEAPFAFVERKMSDNALANQNRFQQYLADPERSPLNLRLPYEFTPGAKLYLRSGLDVDADVDHVLENFFGSANYDVKNLNISDDGQLFIFAAHGPNDHPTDNTWNIYTFNVESETLERVIKDDGIANAGDDTNPIITDNGIFFSSTRDQKSEDELQQLGVEGCYKEEPPENPSLLHKMTASGTDIEQLTFGRYNHDILPTSLTDGQVAFVRWETNYKTIQECAAAERKAPTAADPYMSIDDAADGLEQTSAWDREKTCSLSQIYDGTRVIAENSWSIYLLDEDGKNIRQLYQSVTTTGDEAFLRPSSLVQDESGKLAMLLKHQYNPQAGGALLQLQNNLQANDGTIFANFAPSLVTDGQIDLYPGQLSENGWYSAKAEYRDGSNRKLVSWSQCAIVNSEGINSFCEQGTDGELASSYGIWAVTTEGSGQENQSQLPIVRSRDNVLYTYISVAQERQGKSFPYQALDNGFTDFDDATRIVCEEANNKPIANAGMDQVGPLGTTFSLNGAGSSDEDGDALTYRWTVMAQPEGANAVLINPNNIAPQLTPSLLGEYVVQLIVSDGKESSEPDLMTITVDNVPNGQPIANAGPDQQDNLGATFTLDGSASSDPDQDALNYTWAVIVQPGGSTVELTNATGPTPSLTPAVPGVYRLQLVVNDSKLESTPDIVNVTVISVTTPPTTPPGDPDPDVNVKPSANAGPDQSDILGTRFTLDGSQSSDGDNDTLNFKWTLVSAPEGNTAELIDADKANPSIVPDAIGVYEIQLIVDDNELSSDADTMKITTTWEPNAIPSADAGADQSGVLGTTFTLDGSASSDSDANDTLTFAWKFTSLAAGSTLTDASLNASDTVKPSFTPDVLGDYVIELVVSDGKVSSEADTVTVTATLLGNNKPVANAGPDLSDVLGKAFVLDGSGSSDADAADKDNLRYEWQLLAQPAGSAANLVNSLSAVAGLTPDTVGEYRLQLIVSDNKEVSNPDEVIVTVTEVPNGAPTANAGPDQADKIGTVFTLDGSASSDPEQDSLNFIWLLKSKPADSALVEVSSNRVQATTFTPDVVGEYVIELIVDDGKVSSEADSVKITAEELPNKAPTANAGPDQETGLNTTVTLDGSGSSDEDGDTLIYRWTVLAPAGASLSNTGIEKPTLTVDQKQTYEVQLIVNDGMVDSEPDTVLITIANTKPIASAGDDQTVFKKTTVNLNGSQSSDVDGDTLSFSWVIIEKPADSQATLSNDETATPGIDVDLDGQYKLELIVDDGVDKSDADAVIITVENRKPVANAGADQSATLSETVTLDGSASSDADNDALSYKWTVLSPAGATFDDDTAQQPNIVIQERANYEIQLVVNDGTDNSEPDVMTISAGNAKPVADAGDDVTTNIGAMVQLDGSASTDADNDELSFAWSIVQKPETSTLNFSDANVVNPNLVMDVSGSYVIQLIVNDGTIDSAPDTMEISVENRRPIANAGLDQTVNVNTTVTLDGSASTDEDGDALSYSWTIISPNDNGVSLSDASAIRPTITLNNQQTYVIQLIVNDGKEDSLPDTVELHVGNVQPVANAGPDQTAKASDEITLDGSGSFDVDGNTLSYQWQLMTKPDGSQANLSATDAVKPNFTADVLGEYEVRLIVNDGFEQSEPDFVKINANNTAPKANAGPDQVVSVGNDVVLDGRDSSDVDGDNLNYRWSILSKPAGSSTQFEDATDTNPRFNADFAGHYVIQLIVNDGIVDSAPDTVMVSTENLRPVAEAGSVQEAKTNQAVNLDGSGSFDPDGDSLNFQWAIIHKPDGSSAELDDASAETPSVTPDVDGDYVVQLIVDDGDLFSAPDTVSFSASSPPPVCDISDATQRTIPVVFRDFKDSHPDFEYEIGVDYGIVKDTIGADRKPVYANTYGTTPTTTGKENFDQWYRSCPNINIEIPMTLTMSREQNSTIWEYSNSSFFPIDGLGFGNSGLTEIDHNYHFTLETHLVFDYNGGEEFTFRGDDDLWLYINDKLVIDIGGVHSVIEKSVKLDEIAEELGIEVGQRYSFDLFFAERHTVKSNFKFQTNINLECINQQ